MVVGGEHAPIQITCLCRGWLLLLNDGDLVAPLQQRYSRCDPDDASNF